MKGMNARRFAIVILTFLATIFVWTALGLAGGSPVLAQSPTPTLMPPIATSQGFELDHIYLSQQQYQVAEYAQNSYYNSLEMLNQIQMMSSGVDTRTIYYKELSDGHEFSVDKSYTYGDLTVIIALIALLLLTVIRFIWDVARAR